MFFLWNKQLQVWKMEEKKVLLVIFCVYVSKVQLDRSFLCAFLVENAFFNIGQLRKITM